MRAEFAKVRSPESGVRSSEYEDSASNEPKAETPRPSSEEFWLLKLLLSHDELVAWATLHLDVNWISHPLVRQIVTQRLTAQTNETWKNITALLDECETPEMRSLITEVLTGELVNRTSDGTRLTLRKQQDRSDQQLPDVILKLRNQFLDRQIAASIQRASQPETSEADRMELLRQQQDLRQQKRAPLK